MSPKSCAIAVMAKAPRPGLVKTRLTPPLRPEQATELSASFLRDITENIRAAGRHAAIDGYVAFAPAGGESLFDGMLAEGTGFVLADGSISVPADVQGFGGCLLHAAIALFERGYESVCLLNSDSPTLPTEALVGAAEALSRPGDRMVLGAAEDGGYYLIGMKAPHARLFADIHWSTASVAAETLQRAAEIGLDTVKLRSWYDVDDASALARLIEELAAPAASDRHYPAPATSACLARLGLRRASLVPAKADA